MYKLLLCWRYLLSRYLALACIISVMLGVATLIVVNSVMSGFSTKLRDRLHGLLSDVLVEAMTYDGFANPQEKMERIRKDPYLSGRIEAMTATMEVFAMIQYRCEDQWIMRPVHLIGIDPAGRSQVGGFAEHLLKQKNSPNPTFNLSKEAFLHYERANRFPPVHMIPTPPEPGQPPDPEPPPSRVEAPEGVIVGNAIASYRRPSKLPGSPGEEVYLLKPGDQAILITLSGQKLAPVFKAFAVTDYFKSEMSEYDSNYVFVPLKTLQKLRTMEDRVTSLQIKLKNFQDAKGVVEALRTMFPVSSFRVETWEDKQSALLAAISVEKGILNVLLFLIIGVAGFGILAIFSMIVVEKTRDIGILKALGASNGGVMKIFLGYGLLLGVVGACLGTALGLTLTTYINEIEKLLARVTGQDFFPRDIYYFDKIPTDIQTWSVVLVNVGSVLIAVIFSVLPSLRAAMLHPVRALRYE